VKHSPLAPTTSPPTLAFLNLEIGAFLA